MPTEKEQKNKGGNGQMSEKNEAKCTEWKAWHDRQPGHAATLHVIGQCTFPTSGFSVELRPQVPPGINPTIYILDRIVHSPTDPVTNPRITTVPVHYTEQTEKKYKSIQILPDQVEVPVKEVSEK
jgi:hypothetical protein